MPYNPPKVKDPSKIIRIEMLEAPAQYEKGEGEYEVRFGDTPKDKVYHDLFSLERWLKTVWAERVDDILSRLQNFNLCYIDLVTREITT